MESPDRPPAISGSAGDGFAWIARYLPGKRAMVETKQGAAGADKEQSYALLSSSEKAVPLGIPQSV